VNDASHNARSRPAPWVLGLWLATSFLSSICGIGGGLFAVPILHYLVGLPIRHAIGTSLVTVFVLSATATAAEAGHAGSALDLPVVALLLAGGYAGAQIGFRVAKRLDARLIKRLFVIVLVFAGLRVLALDAAAEGSAVRGDSVLDLARCIWVVAIGFGGGFLAPLLGVGGGVIVVPALFLTLPGLGYLEARACSMAMTVDTSAQSSVLYLRARSVDLPSARWFAAATAVGSVLGVFAVHQPGWADAARVSMALVMLVVAARIGWDVARRSKAPPAGSPAGPPDAALPAEVPLSPFAGRPSSPEP